MALNFEKICRVCLIESEKMMSVFKVNVSRKIMACASVQVWPNDDLPPQICNKCCAKLHVAFQFKKQCEKADSKLRTYVKNAKPMEKQQNEMKQQDSINLTDNNLGKHLINNKLNEISKAPTIQLQSSGQPNNCLYLECNVEIMNAQTQEQAFIQNVQPIQQISQINDFNLIQNQTTLQNPVQMANYNIQNVIYSTTYPVTLQPMQTTNNLIVNQAVTSLPIHQQPAQQTQSQVVDTQQSTLQMNTENHQNNVIPIQTKSEDKATTNPNRCPICFKLFLNTTRKNRHMKIHSRNDMPFKCNICNKEFIHGGNYKIHMRMHNNERPFCCTVCPKRFVQAQDLEKHIRTHTGERPHKCSMCWKAFSTGSNLIAHIRTHTGERPYVCSVCSKAFCQSNELTKHMRTHTGEKSHVCDICHKGFNGSSTLIVHKRSHTGEKPFVCKICGKSFTQSGCLTAHLKRYGETKYQCDSCTSAFHSDKVLQMHHKSKHHNENIFECQTFDKHSDAVQGEFDEHRIIEQIDSLNVNCPQTTIL